MQKLEAVYTNKYYTIFPEKTGSGYQIFNRLTGVLEGTSDILHASVSKADVWSELLEELLIEKGYISNESSD